MDWIRDLLAYIPSVEEIVRFGGHPALVAIIFAECGLLIGFFLPGDSLLVTAGLFAAKGDLNIWLMLVTLTVASIVGNSVGYWIGLRIGKTLFEREDSRFFKRRHLVKAHDFYERHGGKAIILARFVPIVRTFVPTIAGAVEMSFAKFTFYNVVGGVLWIWSMLLVGYVLGSMIPGIDKKIEYVIVIVVALSLLPAVIEWWRERRRAAAEGAKA
jgi:membrane-associated protein